MSKNLICLVAEPQRARRRIVIRLLARFSAPRIRRFLNAL